MNTAELSDLLIQQNHIGSVIKVHRAVMLVFIKLVLCPVKILLMFSRQTRSSNWKEVFLEEERLVRKPF